MGTRRGRGKRGGRFQDTHAMFAGEGRKMRALAHGRRRYGPALEYGRFGKVALCNETLSQMDRRDPFASGLIEMIPPPPRSVQDP